MSDGYKFKGAYIKYVGGEAVGFYKFFIKKFRSLGHHRPKYFMAQYFFSENISWPAPLILVSYLRFTCSSISG